MPAIRRYLRVSKYTVVECRIFVPPSDHSWSLRPGLLASVFAAAQPFIKPMLLETRELRGKRLADARKISGDGWEASLRFTKGGRWHSLLLRERRFGAEGEADREGEGEGEGTEERPVVVREESPEEETRLENVPEVQREDPLFLPRSSDEDDDDGDDDDDDDGGDASGDEDGSSAPPPRRRRDKDRHKGKQKAVIPEEGDDEKKATFHTVYDDLDIYGYILAVVLSRTSGTAKGKEKESAGESALMEDWIAMSQAVAGADDD